MKFQSTKVIDGFSTVYRQEKANSHCAQLHGYALSFKVVFEGDLDDKNWVVDFGFMKRSKNAIKGLTPHDWFCSMFDHTVLISGDDSQLPWFMEAMERGIMKGWVLPGGVGCEKFAELVFNTLNVFIRDETNNRVRVVSVECIENQKNSAIVYAGS